MSDKDIDAIIDELLSPNTNLSPAERIILFQDVRYGLPKIFVPGLDLKLYNVLKVYLHSNHFDLQKCALNLLHQCLERTSFKSLQEANSLNLAYAVIFLCNTGKDDTPELQELWLKAFDTIHLMSEIYPILNRNHGTRLLSVFQKAINVPYTSSVQKIQALLMLDKYISSVDIQNVKELLYHIASEQLLPLAFSKNNAEYHTLCLQIIYRLLPDIRLVLIKYPEEWEKIFSDIRSKYVPAIEQFIAENNCTFAKLWIFLIKLIGAKFHKGSPVVNSLLSCIEAAFKVPNLEVRKQSFFCWQVLIESFTIDSNEASVEKRVKLLTIPLKTNNGKTAELATVKIEVWGKLLEVLIKNNLIGSYGVLEAYLTFCFGPFCYKENSHTLISQGKKYPSVHLTTCKSLLQLIGNPKYINEDLEKELDVLEIKSPAVKTSEFCDLAECIIDSVGESCIMLSQLDNEDHAVTTAVNIALWKSLFATVDSLENQELKMKAVRDIGKIILVLINIARKKTNLINFGLKPLFKIITSKEFQFCQEELFASSLFIPMIGVIIKKDKILLHDDVITILNDIFIFKRNDEKYFKFLEDTKNILIKEVTINAEKINYLRFVWYIIQEELMLYFEKKPIGEETLNFFYDILNWPINTLLHAKSTEKLDLKWRELYSFFCKNTSNLLQSKLCCKLMKNISQNNSRNNKTIAEYCYYIISNLQLENCDEETCTIISQIYGEMQTIIATPELTPSVVIIYETCVSHMLDTSSKFSKLNSLLPSLNSCLSNLLEYYAKTDILRPALLFLDQIDKNNDGLKTDIETLTKILNKHKTPEIDNKMTSTEVNTNIEKTEKVQQQQQQQPLMILMGHDVNTMTPVKLKGSMLKTNTTLEKQSTSTSPKTKTHPDTTTTPNTECVFINSPYKFDPKKLTKQQKEKLFRRRDDIPALYQDLTQSMSQMEDDLSTSNSEIQTETPKIDDTANIMQTTKESEPKTDTLKVPPPLPPPPPPAETKDSNDNSQSEDIVQSDSDLSEKNTRIKRRRKSLLATETPEPTEKRTRGRKPKNPDANTNSNGTSKENMDVNKITPENSDTLKVTRKRRSVKVPNKLLESQIKNYSDIIASVVENDSNSSDTFAENLSQQSTTSENTPIKLKLFKNKRKSKIMSQETPETTETTTTIENNKDGENNEKMELIALEASNELNKLENVPINSNKAARISRGNRRMSEGAVAVKKPTTEKNIIDYANLFVAKKDTPQEKPKTDRPSRVSRELKLMKLDIKNSDEYLKTNGQKRKSRLQNKNATEQKPNENSNATSDESDFIESSQENEKQVNNIKECEVRALYSLEKITSGLLLQESDANNRPKISPIKINIKSNKLVKSDSPKSTDTSMDKTEELPLIMDKLDSQNVTVQTETESQTQCTQNTTDICEKRKVILSNSLLSSQEETPSTPTKQPNVDNIPTSPVCNDTPTRNKELLEDTLEISPIKKVPNTSDDAPTKPDNPVEDQESPDLFESETAPSQKPENTDTETDKLSGNTSQYTNRMLRKNKSRVMSGRSAKMMKMISAKQTFVPATSTKATSTTTTAATSYCSPSSNRTKKMMISLEKCDALVADSEAANGSPQVPTSTAASAPVPVTPANQTTSSYELIINQDDVLCFEKQLPSPFALPSGSILKRKRNGTEEPTEETIVPVIKKRRVNFSDPPVSCLKFIEKTIKPAISISKHLPKELRTTRASTAEEQEIENEINNATEQPESQTFFGIFPMEEDVDTPTSSEETSITISKVVYDTVKPICEELIDNQEPITKIVAKLAHCVDFVEPMATLLQSKNIATIGDLAKLSESQVHIIPLKVEAVKTVLKEYHENLKPDTPTKEKRKITPLVISSSEEKTEQNTTCEVSVIIENKDVTSETPTTTIPSTSEKDCSEKLFSTESEKAIEVQPINKIITVAVTSSPQQENAFSSPVGRAALKSEFDSPTNAKDNILNEEYCNVRVSKFLHFIRNLFVQKKFDPKPIITTLFANNTQMLTEMNCWEDLVKYIVRDVGIWTLTKYLCSLKNIPALMIESILKNSLNEIGNDFICERLNKHEIIKFLSKEYNLITLLQEYDSQTVYTTFFDLANDTQYTHLKYKEMLQELYSCVFQPQVEIEQMLFNLDAENIGSACCKRMSDPQDMDTFLEKIHKNIPLEVYLKPTKTNKKETSSTSTSTALTSTSTLTLTSTSKEVVSNVVHLIENDQLSKDEELTILRSIAKKWNALEFFQTFSRNAKNN